MAHVDRHGAGAESFTSWFAEGDWDTLGLAWASESSQLLSQRKNFLQQSHTPTPARPQALKVLILFGQTFKHMNLWDHSCSNHHIVWCMKRGLSFMLTAWMLWVLNEHNWRNPVLLGMLKHRHVNEVIKMAPVWVDIGHNLMLSVSLHTKKVKLS